MMNRTLGADVVTNEAGPLADDGDSELSCGSEHTIRVENVIMQRRIPISEETASY